MKNNFNPNRLTYLVKYLMSDEMQDRTLQMRENPVLITYADDSFDYLEPSFQWLIHELLKIFPEEWYETKEGDIVWTMDEEQTTESSLEGFFGLNSEAVMHILIPGRQNIQQYGGKTLSIYASPIEVAVNIMELCNKLTSRGIAASKPIYLN